MNMTPDAIAEHDRINDVEAKIDSQLLALATEYVTLEKRVKAINDEKKLIREKAERLDQHPTAFRTAISWVKLFANGDRISVLSSFHRMIHVLGDRQGQLFPEQAAKFEERQRKAAEKAAENATLKGPDADTNPRSNPDAGGAKPQIDNAAEQAEGEAALADGLKGTVKASQSAKAAAKRSAAGLN